MSEDEEPLRFGVDYTLGDIVKLPLCPKPGDVAYSNAADGTPLRATFDKDGHLGEWEEWLP